MNECSLNPMLSNITDKCGFGVTPTADFAMLASVSPVLPIPFSFPNSAAEPLSVTIPVVLAPSLLKSSPAPPPPFR